jgi:hypothetical protein
VNAKVRLKLILPLAAVAVAGVAVFQLGLLDRLTGSDEDAGAVTPPAATTGAATTQAAQPETSPGPTKHGTKGKRARAQSATGAEQLATALKKSKVVVLVVYTPGGALDTIQIAEARQGADDAGAGFLTINGSKERQVAELASTYDLRSTPTVLVFTRGPELATRFDDFADHVTVAEAAQDARHRS